MAVVVRIDGFPVGTWPPGVFLAVGRLGNSTFVFGSCLARRRMSVDSGRRTYQPRVVMSAIEGHGRFRFAQDRDRYFQ